MRRLLMVVIATVSLLGPSAPSASGSLMPGLVLFQPDPTVGATFVGRGGVTTDGLGQLTAGGTLQADVPAGSSVVLALLYAATVGGGDTTTIRFAGSDVTLAPLPNVRNSGFFSTTRADVTSIVRGMVGSGGRVFDFAVDSDPTVPLLNGVALVVVYANKKQPTRSVSVFDGGLGFGPETTTLSFGRTFRRVPTSFQATLALGIQHGYQGGASTDQGTHSCGTGPDQHSVVDINGSRLTSCAGNYDDGYGQNGALITVGGVGDSLDVPSDPYQTPGDGNTPRTTDDELYDISQFVRDGDSSLSMTTTNPSNDDSIFLAVLTVTGETTEVQSNDFVWPATGKISQNDRSHNLNQDGTSAQDITNVAGTDISAAYAGTVIFAGTTSKTYYCKWTKAMTTGYGFGNFVVIRHDGGSTTYYTMYAHLLDSTVSIGDPVTQGQVIGHMGSTGCSTNSHIHFVIGTDLTQDGIYVRNNKTLWLAPDPISGTDVTAGTPTGGRYPGLR